MCKELEELGGGIQTRLERVSYLRLMKKPASEDHCVSLPPYLVLQDGFADTMHTMDLEDEASATIATNKSALTRQLQVGDIYGFIEENLTKFAQLNLNSTMIFYGAKGAGKSTFLFQTSFFNMLTDQLFGTNGGSATEGLRNLNGAWIEAYEIGIDQRTRVEKKKNLLTFASTQTEEDVMSDGKDGSKISKRGQMAHKVAANNNKNAEKETFVELELTEDSGRI